MTGWIFLYYEKLANQARKGVVRSTVSHGVWGKNLQFLPDCASILYCEIL